MRVLDQGLALCRAVGNQTTLRITAVDLGVAYVLQGRLAEGRTLLEEAISVASRTGALGRAAGWATWLSEVCRLEGHGEEAWQHAYQALDLARQQQARGDEARALHQLGTVHAHADPPDAAQAEAHYQQALALAEALGMRPIQTHCHHGLGTLYARIGQQEQAHAALSTAIAMYRTMEMTFWLPPSRGHAGAGGLDLVVWSCPVSCQALLARLPDLRAPYARRRRSTAALPRLVLDRPSPRQ